MKKISYLLLAGLLMISSISLYAIDLPHFFSNNMVLQRDMPIRIWGHAEKNENIAITFNGNTVSIKADDKGKWEVQLARMSAGGPYEMKISGKNENIIFKNILIGDVWICSGQSNMEFTLKSSEGSDKEISNSANPNIRLLTVPKTVKLTPQTDILPTVWVECNPSTSPNFSAVGYYFGKNLQSELNVPIGLIHTSWGGTNVQTWTSWPMMLQTEDYRNANKEYDKALNFSEEEVEKYKKDIANDLGLKQKWYNPSTKVKGWQPIAVPYRWDKNLKDVNGILWYKKEITLPENIAGKPATIHLSTIDDEDITYINGIKIGETHAHEKIRNYAIPAGIIKAGKNVITVRLLDTGGEAGILGEPEKIYLETENQNFPLAGEWLYKPSTISTNYKIRAIEPNGFPSLLYNGMLHPLIGYSIKGAIWYQGESNEYESFKYRTLFPNLIQDWRTAWGYDFPFFWVQLANFRAIKDEPGESTWAEVREAQNMALKLPKTGQAVITDIGEANDIHPTNKKDVGYRLAQNAFKIAYGKEISGAGPVFESMQIENGRAILKFSNIGNGLDTKDKNRYGYVNGFSIAGNDKKFVWAKAYIDGDKVIVFNEKITVPTAVRYGWADNPYDNNLTNSDGLLASPFRTDF